MTLETNYVDPDTTTPARRLRYPAGVELLILGGLAVVLLIALSLIRSLVAERSNRANVMRGEISSSWGSRQTIGGPVIVVPFRLRFPDGRGNSVFVVKRARILPDQLKVTGTLIPERRKRGIFETVVYRSDLRVEGVFAQPDFTSFNVAPDDILWNEAFVSLGISDLRGVRGTPVLKWNGRALPFSGGSRDPQLLPTGLTAPNVFAGAAPAARYPFSVNLELNGSDQISFFPLGGETIVELTSPWRDPSFTGAFLPETRSVSASGFKARWRISSLARSYPQTWREDGDNNTNALQTVASSAFGVGLYSPIGHYQQTERSLKYGALFIILTFVTFFLYELLSPVTLHPMQYFLVGGALCLFYLLLLSISEHAPFGVAYAVASIATISLISSYGSALLHNGWRVLGLTGLLVLLYSYLYVLLQLEDWALLMGSIGLFLILALVMYTTRRVDWGSAHLGRTRGAEA